MVRLLRAGFWRDMTVLLLVTVVLGSAVAGGVSLVMDRYFAGTVSNLIGDYGEFDFIVHVREDAHAAAAQSLKRIAREELGGARVKTGLSVAGKANFFVSIPPKRRSQQVFEKLNSMFATLPGYAGLTFIIEPSVVVSNVHPAVRTTFINELQSAEGVRFVFRDGANLVAVLDKPSQAQAVYDTARRISERYRILEVRFPFQYRLDNPEQAARDLERAMQDMWGKGAVRDVTVAGDADEMGSFVTTLREMKRFLVGYATRVEVTLTSTSGVLVGDTLTLEPAANLAGGKVADRVTMQVTGINGNHAIGYVDHGDAEPLLGGAAKAAASGGRIVGHATLTNERMQLVEAIDASLELLGQLSDLSKDAGGAVNKAEQTLQTFQAALVQLDTVQEQISQINQELTTKGEANPGQVLLSVLMSGLIKKIQPKSGPSDLEKVDVPGMQASLRDMAERLDAMSQVDMNAISREVAKIRANLPQLSDTEIGDSLHLIDRYLEGQVVPGDQIQLLLQPGVDVAQSEALIKHNLGRQDISLFTSPSAIVAPDARATLFSVLGQVRQTIAGIAALVLVLLAMLLDHSTIFSALKHLRSEDGKKSRRVLARLFSVQDAWAMITGVVLLGGMYLGSGAGIPGMKPIYVVLVGMAIGLLVNRLARRISPVDGEEVVAGVALGLDPAQVMREIVVPAGRPGLLLLLNRPRQIF